MLLCVQFFPFVEGKQKRNVNSSTTEFIRTKRAKKTVCTRTLISSYKRKKAKLFTLFGKSCNVRLKLLAPQSQSKE